MFLLSIALLAFASAVQLKDDIVPRNLLPVEWQEEDIPWKEIQEQVMTRGKLKAGFIEADITDYVLRLIENLGPIFIKDGLDPLNLTNQSINLFPGSLAMNNGLLRDLSTINISSTVIAKYTQSTDILDLTLPLAFDTLLVTYDYKASITLLSFGGGISAKISNVKLDLHMGFNFSSYHVFVDNADVKNSGSISLTFSGYVLLDWIVDLLSGVLTTLFQQIILDVINLIIDDPVESVIKSINKLIDVILQKNTTMGMPLWN